LFRLTRPHPGRDYSYLANREQALPADLPPTLAHLPPYKTIVIDLAVAGGYGLVLELSCSLGEVDLLVRDPGGRSTPIAWIDAHPHPHLFRWRELDLVCRCIAQADSSLRHPGIPLLFLYQFAPICDQEDAEAAFPLLRTAWASLGLFSETEAGVLLRCGDVQGCGFRWEFDEGFGWVLRQDERGHGGAYLHTLREPDNPEFPYASFNGLLGEGARFVGKSDSEPLSARAAKGT
jgi:hypothetical protein